MLLYVFVWMTFAAINIYIFDVTPVRFLKFQIISVKFFLLAEKKNFITAYKNNGKLNTDNTNL